MPRSTSVLMPAAASLAFVVLAPATAATIGINFGSNNGTLAATEETGVVPQRNWVNAPSNFSNTPLALQDADGNAAGAVHWEGDGVGNVTASPSTPIAKLLNGYLHGDHTVTQSSTRIGAVVRVQNLPEAVTAGGYDLIVYWESTNAGVNVGDRTIAIDFGNDGIIEREVAYTNVTNGSEALASFVEGVNFVRINIADLSQGMGTFSLRLTKAASEADIAERGVISGLQIVPVPEPASAALIGVGAMLLASRNRGH